MQKERDPLNLGSLPQVSPPADGWAEIHSALATDKRRRKVVRYAGSLFAVAATLTLAVGLFVQQPVQVNSPDTPAVVSSPAPQTVDSLIDFSQQLENRVRTLRTEVGGMPTRSLIYQVEIEDMIVQVDDELSMQPDSLELWSQRVNLLMDLSRLYQNQLRRDYHRMASL